MKLSKNLLQAMTVGLAFGAITATTSCDSAKENAEIFPQELNCSDTCDIFCKADHKVVDFDPDNCPPCGRG